MNPRRLSLLPALVLLCSLTPAHAGYVRATAVEGSYPAVFVDLPGALAQATSPNFEPGGDAVATATRLRVSAASDGAGAGPTGQFFHSANAANFTEYVLWDFDSNQALPADQARLLNLSFNFRLLSRLSVPVGGVGLDIGSMGYSAEVVSLNSALINGRADSVSYAVGPPDSSTGNLALLGLVDLTFSLMHDDSSSGWLSMGFGNSGANDVTAAGSLRLQTITVTEVAPALAFSAGLSSTSLVAASTASLLSGRNLGVRFDNGATYAFGQDLDSDNQANPMPEPASAALVVLALAVCGRRQAARVKP